MGAIKKASSLLRAYINIRPGAFFHPYAKTARDTEIVIIWAPGSKKFLHYVRGKLSDFKGSLEAVLKDCDIVPEIIAHFFQVEAGEVRAWLEGKDPGLANELQLKHFIEFGMGFVEFPPIVLASDIGDKKSPIKVPLKGITERGTRALKI